MSSGKSQDATTTMEPWGQATPFMTQALNESANQYNTYTPQYYPGQTVAGRPQASLAADNYLQNYSGAMQPFINQAQQSNAFLMDPNKMLNVTENPYISGMVGDAQEQIVDTLKSQVMPGIRAQYRRGQPFGGSREELAVGNAVEGTARAMGSLADQMYGNAYGRGLNSMIQAQNMAGNMARLGALPGDYMSQVGTRQQAYDQDRINAAKERWDYYQRMPWEKLDRYSTQASGIGGMGGTTTSPIADSTMGNLMGLGSLGLGAYQAGLFGGSAAGGAAASIPASSMFGPLTAGTQAATGAATFPGASAAAAGFPMAAPAILGGTLLASQLL